MLIVEDVKIKKVRAGAKLPVYATNEAAGADLHACIDENIMVKPGQTVLVPTGLSFALPVGYAGLIYARSGLASKKGLAPANKVGVVDSDYRGEVMVALFNHSQETRVVEIDERIAQFIITPYVKADFEEVEELDDSERGSDAFGSTGKK